VEYIESGDLSIAIDLDQGARIASILYQEFEVTLPFRGTLVNWGWYAMAPWAGRIRDGIVRDSKGMQCQLPITLDPPHALHGFGILEGWQELGKGVARLELPEPYFGASIEQRIEVLDDAIRWSLEYESGGVDLPAWIGMHPWFAREIADGSQAELTFRAEKMLQRGSDGLPTGELITPSRGPWDDAFTDIRGLPQITWGDRIRVTIESDAPWWVVYNEDSEGICVEPQSAPPDAANLSLEGLSISGDQYLETLFIFESL